MSIGPPYRPPCDGWDDAKKNLEGCFSHTDPADNGEPDFEGGWPRYVNTTKIDKVTTLDEIGDPITVPPERVCPYAIPRCWDGDENPPLCLDDPPTREPNVYAIANGQTTQACDDTYPAASTVNYASCRKYGFKNVQARKSWHGRYGFGAIVNDEYPIGGTKYLTKSMFGTASIDNGTGRSFSVTITKAYSVDSSSGKVIEVGCSRSANSVGGDPEDPGGCVNEEQVEASLIELMLLNYQNGAFIGSFLQDHLNGVTTPFCWQTLDSSVTETEISVSYSTVVSDCDCDPLNCPPECTESSDSFEVSIVLSDPYTAADVDRDVESLLAYWDLDDDVVYPWRTDALPDDVPPFTACPCSGPAYAPLVTYDEKGATTPDVFADCGYVDTSPNTGEIRGKPVHVHLGLPNRGGNDAYWDSLHENWTWEFILALETNCWRHTSWGAYAPSWCPNATQWTEDFSYQIFHEGAWSAFNAGHINNGDGCSWPAEYLGGYLIKTKWAETIYFEMPSHNYARPCGPTDQGTIDPDTIDCEDDGFGGYVNPGNLQFPDAPASCEDIYATIDGESYLQNDTDKKGDYCIKKWVYDYRSVFPLSPQPLAGALTEMTCEQRCATYSPCYPSVVYIQSNAPTRPGAIHIENPGVAIDETYGSYAITQSHMHMTDPLWKHPRFPCDDEDNPGDLDPDAVTPYEECRDCGDGTCDDYVDRVNGGVIPNTARCEPGTGQPWAQVEVDAP